MPTPRKIHTAPRPNRTAGTGVRVRPAIRDRASYWSIRGQSVMGVSAPDENRSASNVGPTSGEKQLREHSQRVPKGADANRAGSRRKSRRRHVRRSRAPTRERRPSAFRTRENRLSVRPSSSDSRSLPRVYCNVSSGVWSNAVPDPVTYFYPGQSVKLPPSRNSAPTVMLVYLLLSKKKKNK